MTGRYFDEWSMGERIVQGFLRTVTETYNLLLSSMTLNPPRLPLDVVAAKASKSGCVFDQRDELSQSLRGAPVSRRPA